jgi:hypothetical protein
MWHVVVPVVCISPAERDVCHTSNLDDFSRRVDGLLTLCRVPDRGCVRCGWICSGELRWWRLDHAQAPAPAPRA